MDDAAKQSGPTVSPQPLPNPLRDLHEQAGAEFQPYLDLEIVSTFGEPQAEYAAIRKRCALMDLPQRGILELTGKDRLSFLGNLLTNETWDKAAKKGLAAGQGVYAFFLNLKGRVVADMNVIERGDRTLVETDARLIEPLRAALDKYLFVEQVKMVSRIGSLHELALHGPAAPAVLDAAVGTHVPELPPLGSTTVTMFDIEATVWRDDVCGVPGLHLIIPAETARTVWMNLIARFYRSGQWAVGSGQTEGTEARRHEGTEANAGVDMDTAIRNPQSSRLRPAGWAAFNATRIEAGRPVFGIDFDDTVLPAETGLFDRAVSVTKGCYLGQEIVARMYARKQVARQVVGLKLADDSLPIAGAPLHDEQGNQVGAITSSTVSPVLSNAAICLGMVKKPHFAEGTVLKVPAEGAMREATVVKTPFVKPLS